MIFKQCKRLAEVDFPDCRRQQALGAREVDAARASELAASLVGVTPARGVAGDADGAALPDPEDAACPGEFKDAARKALSRYQAHRASGRRINEDYLR